MRTAFATARVISICLIELSACGTTSGQSPIGPGTSTSSESGAATGASSSGGAATGASSSGGSAPAGSSGIAAGSGAADADVGDTALADEPPPTAGMGPQGGSPNAPTGLLCELTSHPELAAITDSTPDFAWIVNSPHANERQSAYQVLVASSQANLDADQGDFWDSGKVTSGESLNVSYAGKPLAAGVKPLWKVRTWDSTGTPSLWSAAQSFAMGASTGTYSTAVPSVLQTAIPPGSVAMLGSGHYFLDFGRDAFGWLELTLDAPADGTAVTVNLGEKASGQAVDLTPGATIRAAQAQVVLQKGLHTYRVQTPPIARGFPLPSALGVVMPFRYAEVVNAPVNLTTSSARQVALTYPFDNAVGAFGSSNDVLNQVWKLSRYTTIATTFDDIYVDGDRERKPYEADGYMHQLAHYALDRDYALARNSHEYLMTHPTWPTEWKFHSIMMAWTDWMYTGNTESLAQVYPSLKSAKTLESYMGSDGLLNTSTLRDLVDWPTGERDGYVMTGANTVVNAFWCHILELMADLAKALGNTADATRYATMAATATTALNAKFFNQVTGLYVDGATTAHSSLHANMFPLAFGLVPADHQASVIAYVKSRGMACSVYGAQYLLEALYQVGQPDAALALLTSTTDRSWMNMIRVGSTMTMEAWDVKYKSNLDWNHAWGAAPANIIPRYLIGVRPLTPGFAKAVVQPQPGSLMHIDGTVATIRGPIRVVVDAQPLTMTVTIPVNMTANVAIPSTTSCVPTLDGQMAQVTPIGPVLWLNDIGSGPHVIRCQ